VTPSALGPVPRRTDPVRELARAGADATAVVERARGRRWSYQELDGLADAWAQRLDELEVGPGDRVATLLGNRIDHVALLFASHRVGAALVPLNWRLAPRELAPILVDARPARIVTEGAYRGLCDEAAARLPDMPAIVDVDEASPARDAGDAPALPDRIPEPDEPAVILYTSGSTGQPKGAMLSHRQLYANARATTEGWGLTGDDVAPITTPLFHTGGWNVFATPLWSVGGTVVLLDGFDPDDYLHALRDEACTTALAVPTQLHMLAQSPLWGRPLPALRCLVSGGAACPGTLSQAVRDAGYAFREGYGLTECGPNCFAQTPEESAARPGWVGRPIPYLDARIVDDVGRPLSGAGEGELQLRGPQVFSGYLRDAERTAEAFTADGWLRTGDVAGRSEDGWYRICGRIKEMFISGGENVYPGEVESALLEHPDIAEVVVVGVPDDKWGEVGRAFVVLRADATLTPQDVRRFARGRLAAYKVPKTVSLQDALPRLGSGKVDRAALPGDRGTATGPSAR